MESEKQYIRDNCNDMKDVEIARELARMTGRKVTLQAVRKQRQHMGLAKKCGRGLCGLVTKTNEN